MPGLARPLPFLTVVLVWALVPFLCTIRCGTIPVLGAFLGAAGGPALRFFWAILLCVS